MNRIVHFEINAADLQRAADFYSKVFGWKIEKRPYGDEEYWVVMTGEKEIKEAGINGGLVKRLKEIVPATGTNAFVCTIQVDDFDATEKKILAAGGMVAVLRTIIDNLAWQGYFFDTEGNMFGLHQTFKMEKG
ncbi:MAG: VOC family protein [Chitinispirillaceae bacterium]|nr:VOC family protein [Chitinispirillaceae bacterium]